MTIRHPALDAVEAALEQGDLYEGLRVLARRTPHRFTGMYRYAGDMLRNVALIDKFAPELRQGGDVTMGDAYCGMVRDLDLRDGFAFGDASCDARFARKGGSPVMSYCGVMVRTPSGEPFGTLCHFDLLPCDVPFHDLDLLHAAAPHFLAAVVAGGLAPTPS